MSTIQATHLMLTRHKKSLLEGKQQESTTNNSKPQRIYYRRESYREHSFDEPYLTHHGALYHIHGRRDFAFPRILTFYILWIFKFMVVGDQSQIFCDILIKEKDRTIQLLEEITIKLDDTDIWQWYAATLEIQSKLEKINFVPKGFFKKYKYNVTNYKSFFSIGEKNVYHQYFVGEQKSQQHAPCKVQIEDIYPQPDSPLLYHQEYNVRILNFGRRHHGTKVAGGKTCGIYLNSFQPNENAVRWNTGLNICILNAARKAVLNNCQYFVDEHCVSFKEIYLDLDIDSAFYAKPQVFENSKNCTLTGFDGQFSYRLLHDVIMNTYNYKLLLKRVPQQSIYGEEETIAANPRNLIIFGSHCYEYAMEYGVISYVINTCKADIVGDRKFLNWTLSQQCVEENFDLLSIKKYDSGSEFKLVSDIQMKYHRKTSKIFVSKFSWTFKNEEMNDESEMSDENDMSTDEILSSND
eukprot:22678_1